MSEPDDRATPSSSPSAPDGGGHPTASQPAYGRIIRPEYGAMTSDFPAGYNPYPYGAPEHSGGSERPDDAQSRNTQRNAYPSMPSERQDGRPPQSVRQGSSQPGQSSPPWNMPVGTSRRSDYGPGARNDGRRRYFHGVDLDDPTQNPLYGHWDSYAVIAFVFALSSIPLLPAIMGGVAMWRTRTFRMKGFGLALAAVILNLAVTAVDVWMMVNGISTAELLQWVQSQTSTSGGQGSGSLTT